MPLGCIAKGDAISASRPKPFATSVVPGVSGTSINRTNQIVLFDLIRRPDEVGRRRNRQAGRWCGAEKVMPYS